MIFFISLYQLYIYVALKIIIASFFDIQMFNIKYLTMYKVQMLILVDYLPVGTHKPYTNLHL